MEVKASELRIGNLLRVKKSNEVINDFYDLTKVQGIGHTFVTIQRIEGYSAFEDIIIEDFLPIPLTEEILLKCGFVNGVNVNWGLPFLPISDIDYIGLNKEGKIFFKGIYPPCIYLHQLQNLYYSLCGKELEINL